MKGKLIGTGVAGLALIVLSPLLHNKVAAEILSDVGVASLVVAFLGFYFRWRLNP